MSNQSEERKTPLIFQTMGRSSRVRKVRVKCLGPTCNKEMFDSESRHVRLCPKCKKYVSKMQSAMG